MAKLPPASQPPRFYRFQLFFCLEGFRREETKEAGWQKAQACLPAVGRPDGMMRKRPIGSSYGGVRLRAVRSLGLAEIAHSSGVFWLLFSPAGK